jgi:hypothetical protein
MRALGADGALHASLEAKVEVQTILLGMLAAALGLDGGGLGRDGSACGQGLVVRGRHQRFFGSSQDGQISAAWAAS